MKKKYEVRYIVTAVASIPVYRINSKTEAYKLAAKDGWGMVYRDENNAMVCDEDCSADLYTKNGGYWGISPYEEVNTKEIPKQAAAIAVRELGTARGMEPERIYHFSAAFGVWIAVLGADDSGAEAEHRCVVEAHRHLVAQASAGPVE